MSSKKSKTAATKFYSKKLSMQKLDDGTNHLYTEHTHTLVFSF